MIVAHRYGTTAADEISYTEKEYDYACKSGVPVLGFVIDENTPWPPSLQDPEAQKQEALKRFKEKVRGKQVAFWKDKGDLEARVMAAVPKVINLRPRPGWVRGTEAAGPEVLAEISRLSAENAELREKLRSSRPPDLAFHLQSVEVARSTANEGFVESHFVINPRDGQKTSIPLDMIQITMQRGNDAVTASVYSCSGIATEGRFGRQDHLLIDGPRAAQLRAEFVPAPWLLEGDSVEIKFTFSPVGFASAYVVAGTLKKVSLANDDWKWVLSK